MPEEFGLLSWPDGEELFDSQKEPGSRSTSAHKPGSPQKSSQATFRPFTEEQFAARAGAPQPNTGPAGVPRSWARQLVEENREELIAATQVLLVKGYELAKPRVRRAFKEHVVPYTKRHLAVGRTKLEQLRQERRVRRATAKPEATVAQPFTHPDLQPAPKTPQNAFEVGAAQMTADELRLCRIAAAELRIKAALLDRIADAAQVIPEQETLELDDSAVTISQGQLPIDALALEAPQGSKSDVLDQIRQAPIREVLDRRKE